MWERLSLKSLQEKAKLSKMKVKEQSNEVGRTEIQAAKELVCVLNPYTAHLSTNHRLCVLPDSDKNKLDCCENKRSQTKGES